MKLRGIKNNTGLFVTLFATIVITITVIATASLYAVDNLDISDVTFVKNYRAITLSWTYNLSTTETYTSNYFALYRATDGTGANAQRIAVLPGNQTTCTDIALLPEHTYFYAIAHGNNASPVSSITTSTLGWSNGQEVPAVGPQSDVCINPQNGTSCYQSGCHIRQVVLDANPHAEKGGKGADGKTNNTCAMCHAEHGAAGSSTQILMTTQDSTEPNAKVAVCKNCHMGSSVS